MPPDHFVGLRIEPALASGHRLQRFGKDAVLHAGLHALRQRSFVITAENGTRALGDNCPSIDVGLREIENRGYALSKATRHRLSINEKSTYRNEVHRSPCDANPGR